MVDDIGIKILVPLLLFGFLIVGSYMMSNAAFGDVMARRTKK